MHKRRSGSRGQDNRAVEHEPLDQIGEEKPLVAYQPSGLWHRMDTYLERQLLTNMWTSGDAPRKDR